MPSVITANILRSGAVAYLTDGGRWVSELKNATVIETPEKKAALEALALATLESSEVTAVYEFDVRLTDRGPEPVSVRERIRAQHAVAA